jgi:hypothetical protein
MRFAPRDYFKSLVVFVPANFTLHTWSFVLVLFSAAKTFACAFDHLFVFRLRNTFFGQFF